MAKEYESIKTVYLWRTGEYIDIITLKSYRVPDGPCKGGRGWLVKVRKSKKVNPPP